MFKKQIDNICVTIADPYPRWVNITYGNDLNDMQLHPNEAKDLIYALQTLLDLADKEDEKRSR